MSFININTIFGNVLPKRGTEADKIRAETAREKQRAVLKWKEEKRQAKRKKEEAKQREKAERERVKKERAKVAANKAKNQQQAKK